MGIAQATKLLILKPLNSQTAISTVQMKINHCQHCENITSLLREKYLACSPEGRRANPQGVHQTRVLQGCHVPGPSPCHGLTLADKQGCAEQIALREEPMEGKHKH